MNFRLERLTAEHPVGAFTCGKRPGAAEIDEFLRPQALAQQTLGLSSVTVAVDPETARVVGFYSLSPLSIRIDDSVKVAMGLEGSPYRGVEGYLLGRLGVSVDYQGKEYGPLLVERAIDAARKARTQTGGAFLAVDPKNVKLLNWYLGLQFGFVRLDAKQSRIVLRL